jgi:hypothetical protein
MNRAQNAFSSARSASEGDEDDVSVAQRGGDYGGGAWENYAKQLALPHEAAFHIGHANTARLILLA